MLSSHHSVLEPSTEARRVTFRLATVPSVNALVLAYSGLSGGVLRLILRLGRRGEGLLTVGESLERRITLLAESCRLMLLLSWLSLTFLLELALIRRLEHLVGILDS